jgi:hypothetical protein
MTAPLVTLRIRLRQALLQRVEALGAELDVSPAGFIEFAIENELGRQEATRMEEQAALEQLQASVLATGQSLSIQHDAEADELVTCQLCLRAIPRGSTVDGPLLCDGCYALARGPHAPAPG